MGTWESWRQWLRRTPRGLAVTLGVAMLLCVIVACSGCALLIGLSLGNIRLPAQTDTSISSTPSLDNLAVLGGTPSAFEGVYGNPIVSSKTTLTYSPTSTGDVKLAVNVIVDPALDGKVHISSITLTLQFDASTWSEDKAVAVADTFAPRDAVHIHDAKVQGVVDHVYASVSLGNTFSASQFVDDSGKLVARGTFDVECQPIEEDTGLGTCVVGLGDLGTASSQGIGTPTPNGSKHSAPSTPQPGNNPTPKPGATATPRPTATPAPRPTPTPTPKPTPTSSPTASSEG